MSEVWEVDNKTRVMLDTEYLIPVLIPKSVVDAMVHPTFLATVTTASGPMMIVTGLRCWGVRNGWAVKRVCVAVAGRSVCTDSCHTRSSLCHAP